MSNDLNESHFLSSMGVARADQLREAGRIQRMREDIGCELCDYLGYVTTSDGKGALCKCMKRKAHHRLYEEAMIPRALWDKTLDDWDTRQDARGYDLGAQQKLSERVKKLFDYYARNLRHIVSGHPPSVTHAGGRDKLHSLLLEGGNGSGKTFLIAVTLQDALRQGYTTHFVEWSDLIDICRSFHKEDDQDRLREIFGSYDLVAIDNATVYDNLPSQCIVQLDRLFRARLNSGKPVLIGAEVGWENIVAGSGWRGLVAKCLVVDLPRTDQRTHTRM
jgi:DNA replication protein DnaC